MEFYLNVWANCCYLAWRDYTMKIDSSELSFRSTYSTFIFYWTSNLLSIKSLHSFSFLLLSLVFPFLNSLLYNLSHSFMEFCVRAGITAVFSQVQGGLFSGHFTGTSARCHQFFSDTVCPLKVTCDSCRITAHLVTLLPESFPRSPFPGHQTWQNARKKLCVPSESHPRYLLSSPSRAQPPKCPFPRCVSAIVCVCQCLCILLCFLFLTPSLTSCLILKHQPLHPFSSHSSLIFLVSLKSTSQENVHLKSRSADWTGSWRKEKRCRWVCKGGGMTEM